MRRRVVGDAEDDPLDLLRELAVSTGIVAVALMTHLAGLMGLLHLIRWAIDHLRTPWKRVDRFAIPLLMIVSLFGLHVVEIREYALLLWGLTIPSLHDALYISTAAYSTASVEYFAADPAWRLVAAHESVVGMLLIGWSTAFLFATLHRILTTEESHPLPEGAIAKDD